MEMITSQINKCDLKVNSTRNARDGGIVLCCDNAAETIKVKQIVSEKLGANYEVNLPSIKRPRLRISNIDINIPNDEIINQLKEHNEIIRAFDLKMITVFNKKLRNSSFNEIIIELKGEEYKILIDIGVLKLPWRECKVYAHLHLKRCFKCCGFSHISSSCTSEQKCSKCSGSHKFSECKSKNMCCINCKILNDKYGLKMDTKHHAWGRECGVLQRRMNSLRNKIEYNDKE